jgi:hypothetical protein
MECAGAGASGSLTLDAAFTSPLAIAVNVSTPIVAPDGTVFLINSLVKVTYNNATYTTTGPFTGTIDPATQALCLPAQTVASATVAWAEPAIALLSFQASTTTGVPVAGPGLEALAAAFQVRRSFWGGARLERRTRQLLQAAAAAVARAILPGTPCLPDTFLPGCPNFTICRCCRPICPRWWARCLLASRPPWPMPSAKASPR